MLPKPVIKTNLFLTPNKTETSIPYKFGFMV